MTLEKALEIVKAAIATKNKKNEIKIADSLQFSIACTILSQNLSIEQLQQILQD